MELKRAFVRRLFLLFAVLSVWFFASAGDAREAMNSSPQDKGDGHIKLYWFIPDGMRADPDLFNVFQWAEAGELPNIKKMMETGAYGYSIPAFPSHTPTNFATLFTGTYPLKHGVADGPMHTEGNPLDKVSVSGFNSAAKKVDPIWVTLEDLYDQKVVLLSIPGSTPPELDEGITIRGRWGGWGADFHAVNFEEESDGKKEIAHGRGAKLFFFGPQLTIYQKAEKSEGGVPSLQSYSTIKEARLTHYGKTIYAYIYDSTNNEKMDYDRIAFFSEETGIIADLKEGQWSDWIPIILTWQELPVKTLVKIKVIKVGDDGFFRIRFFYNNLNKYVTEPSFVAEEIINGVGPMVDFVDNFPPQLIFYEEDKETFIEEARMSWDWHRDAADFILKTYRPDIFINDTYTPNQMLTSRWWMGYIDPSSIRYNDVSEEERRRLWNEVKEMYKKLDDILGELLKHADENTYVVLSSDHGAVPLNKTVRLNNLFAGKGWLKFSVDPKTRVPGIDWGNSKVVYVQMAHIYINPQGLGGNWTRASGKEYEKLREEVKAALLELKDEETGVKPILAVYNWEDVPQYLHMPVDRVGDLVIVNEAGYGLEEGMTQDGSLFLIPQITGYKQAVWAEKEKGTWTPFLVVGPHVKRGFRMEHPIHHVDQYPTIMKLLEKKAGLETDGRILNEIME